MTASNPPMTSPTISDRGSEEVDALSSSVSGLHEKDLSHCRNETSSDRFLFGGSGKD